MTHDSQIFHNLIHGHNCLKHSNICEGKKCNANNAFTWWIYDLVMNFIKLKLVSFVNVQICIYRIYINHLIWNTSTIPSCSCFAAAPQSTTVSSGSLFGGGTGGFSFGSTAGNPAASGFGG